MMQAYCVKCRAKREIKQFKTVTMKNGKPATQGVCPTCGTKIFRIGAAKPITRVAQFPEILEARLKELYELGGKEDFIMPIGLFLLLDKENGGDATAEEIQKRFKFLHLESGNIIDFYFLGWYGTELGTINFTLEEFHSFLNLLRTCRIKRFGGYADLILVDAVVDKDFNWVLNFPKAIHIDLARQMAERNFPTLGGLLQSIIEAAEEVKKSQKSAKRRGVVFSISNKLGIAVGKQSILDFFLDKWGKIIGAKSLATLAIKNLGPEVTKGELWEECLHFS